jgi:hypothetical protein
MVTKQDNDRKKKDVWDILDIIAKGVLAIAVSGGIAFYGIVVDERQALEQKEKNRKR